MTRRDLSLPSHHPSESLLMDYASGALGEAWSLGIVTHLAFCPACRSTVHAMEAIGGGLLEDAAPAGVSADLLESVMSKLDREEPEVSAPAPISDRDDDVMPRVLRGYFGGGVDELPWKRLGLGASQCIVPTDDAGVTARLLRIPAGKPVPEHTHRGLEMTIVLQGAFADQSGVFARGDFEEADEQTFHQPHARPGDDCICLAITDAPLRFTGLAVRAVQPLLGI